ncbi:hypothetical protein [Massilia genomosp. 1]|uniref:Mercuric transport protein MerT n=1 Tax=Massilia genomosp. 1 TaxID=2609280 RepID=A0ABX0MQ86_9BURK|nr:hypothetical protein [Massilia genomosp. 1]NHZ61519.1 hypothetical protein [Massilia genomosp. 1]
MSDADGGAGLRQTSAASLLSLLTSASTLICCALPAVLVALGAGAALSSVIAAVPQLVWFSEHKELVFGCATVMLVLSGAMQWRARSLPCPADRALAARCASTRRSAARVYAGAVGLYLLGGFFAFIAPLL